MHGGTNRGAPEGEKNGMFKHGGMTKEAVDLRHVANRLIFAVRDSYKAK